MRPMPAVLLVPTVLSLSAPAFAVRTYIVGVNPGSTFASNVETASPLAGTFIGNYDATTNPTGTRTLPGLFGGSGNNPISYTSTLRAQSAVDSVPSGTMVVTIDDDGLGIQVEELSLDLLGRKPGAIDVTLDILYPSFHTASPSSIYPGGVTIPIPLGSGEITTISAVQNGPALGLLVPITKTSYQFNVAVPVDVLFSASFQGQEFGGTPTPAVLPFVGTLTVNGDTISLDVSASNAGEVVQPIDPPQTIDSQPLALPTVFPAGNTANLLLSGSINQVTVGQTLDLGILASGVASCNPADFSGNCVVDSPDLAILLAAYGGRGPCDLNHDGIVNAQDLALLLAAWGL